MLSEKEKPLCSRQRFIVIFCFQNSQANNAAAVTIKALPASDSSIGAANGHNSSAITGNASRRTIHSTTMFYQFFDLFQCKHFVHLSAVRLRVN
jgi:hypothetical protein